MAANTPEDIVVDTSWSLEQRFPQVSNRYKKIDNLHRLQRYSVGPVKCHVQCEDLKLETTEQYSVMFNIEPDPLQPRFTLEFCLRPPPKHGDTSAYVRDRITACFSAADESSRGYTTRIPHTYNGGKEQPPKGPFDFSDQLYSVLVVKRADAPQNLVKVDEKQLPLAEQYLFGWSTKSCALFSPSRSLTGFDTRTSQAVATFKAILDRAFSSGKRIYVATFREFNKLSGDTWPRFASLPAPAPPSYWPWLRAPGSDPKDIMDFSSRSSFELDSAWIGRALGQRRENFYFSKGSDAIEDCKQLPSSEAIMKLPKVVRFQDSRQYIAHILGSQAYEEAQTNQLKYKSCNGERVCDIYQNDEGTRAYIVLLRLRPPSTSGSESAVAAQEAGAGAFLPEIGERVQLKIVLNQNFGEEEWHGSVVRIPAKYQQFGWTVGVLAIRPPSNAGDQALRGKPRHKADFFFGHSGSPSAVLRQRIISQMMGDPSGFWMKFLLAHDNQRLPKNDYEGDMPPDWRDDIEKKFLQGLNKEQKQVVFHFYTHRVTLLVGPPGTGKSTVINKIAEIEAYLNHQFWICTDSNAALDVLAKKFAASKQHQQPGGFFRLRPAFNEHLRDGGGLPGDNRPGTKLPTDISLALKEQLRLSTSALRLMSLGAYIERRVEQLRANKLGSKLWPEEDSLLDDLDKATRAVSSIRVPDSVEDQQVETERIASNNKLIRKQFQALRALQTQYVARSRGIFSTASSASGPLMQSFTPRSLIMDESSQFSEDKAAHAILHAYRTQSLRRVLLVGDHNQLPPTLMADRNPFSETTSMSLFQRLIEAETPYIQLRTQYRTHPTISAVYNQVIYQTQLVDGENTKKRVEIQQFQKLTQALAKEANVKDWPMTCSVLLSPIQNEGFHFGSEKRAGSTSRVNYQNAAIVFYTAWKLVKEGQFAPKDILISAFYSDQVVLLKALLLNRNEFESIQISTVDGSQGDEALVHIIDCVVLGAGSPNDSMGFLSTERRRWNVAMSRGMVGRIVVGHQNMMDKHPNKDAPWAKYLKQIRETRSAIPTRVLQAQFLSSPLKAYFMDIKQSFQKQESAPAPANQLESRPVEASKPTSTSKAEFAKMVVAGLTNGSGEDAERYLKAANNDIDVAREKYEMEIAFSKGS